jgi:hypothetical protein
MGNDAIIPDQVDMYYHACLYRPDATRLQCWDAHSQAVHQRILMASVSKSVGELAEQVMSDAAASLMRSIEKDPAVQQWVTTARDSSRSDVSVSRIALVGWPLLDPSDGSTKVEACLRRAIATDLPGTDFVGQQMVRESLYPLLQRSTQPQDEEAFAELMARADVQARLRGLGAEHLVAFAGGMDPGSVKGLAGCGYSGCLGFLWRSENSRLDAVLWNLTAAPTAQATSAAANGTTVVPVFVLPIPLPAHTLEAACEELGRKIASAIRATAAPSPTPARLASPAAPPAVPSRNP